MSIGCDPLCYAIYGLQPRRHDTDCGTMVSTMNIDNDVWFKGNAYATIMNYKDPKRAVKRHEDADWQQTLQALLDGGGRSVTPSWQNKDILF